MKKSIPCWAIFPKDEKPTKDNTEVRMSRAEAREVKIESDKVVKATLSIND